MGSVSCVVKHVRTTELVTVKHAGMSASNHHSHYSISSYSLLSFFCGTCLTGYDYIKNGKRELAPKHSKHEVLPPTDTEIRANYRQPKQKPELLQHSFNTHPNVTCPGIGMYAEKILM